MTDPLHFDALSADASSADASSADAPNSASLHSASLHSDSSASDSSASGDLDALLSFLQIIEDQPLSQRAPAFVQVHDKLRSALEVADTVA